MEQDVFNSSFFTLVALAVCEPSSIGFNMADLEVMTQLPEVCAPLLKALASTPYRAQLESGIRKRITVQRYVQFFAHFTKLSCVVLWVELWVVAPTLKLSQQLKSTLCFFPNSIPPLFSCSWNHLCLCVLCLFSDSVEELCAIDLYETDTRDSHANMHLLLSACKQLHQSGLLNSVLHSQVHTE